MTLTRRAFALTLPALAACATSHAAPPDDVLTTAMAGRAVPGMAALVIRDFKPETERVAGLRALGDGPVQPGDRWHLGSDGKALTATMIATLVERGALAWDTPLARLLPDLAMQPAYRDVTLPDLLSHRAGLPENSADEALFASFYDDTAPLPAQRLRYITAALGEAPVGPARGEGAYSNTGYVIAAAAAERATGQAYETLMAQHVFAPLGMASPRFTQFGDAGEPRGHVDGRIADRQRDPNPPMFAPCGGMRMSLQDWARFCIDQMQGERGAGRVLRADAYKVLHAAQGNTANALGWGAAARPMGLRGPALTHAGSDGNWYALVCLFPETGAGVLVTANAADSMGGDAASVAAIKALARTVAEPAT